jgi:hypothetical protein
VAGMRKRRSSGAVVRSFVDSRFHSRYAL